MRKISEEFEIDLHGVFTDPTDYPATLKKLIDKVFPGWLQKVDSQEFYEGLVHELKFVGVYAADDPIFDYVKEHLEELYTYGKGLIKHES